MMMILLGRYFFIWCMVESNGSLKILIRNLRTKKYEKAKIQGDLFPELFAKESEGDKFGQ